MAAAGQAFGLEPVCDRYNAASIVCSASVAANEIGSRALMQVCKPASSWTAGVSYTPMSTACLLARFRQSRFVVVCWRENNTSARRRLMTLNVGRRVRSLLTEWRTLRTAGSLTTATDEKGRSPHSLSYAEQYFLALFLDNEDTTVDCAVSSQFDTKANPDTTLSPNSKPSPNPNPNEFTERRLYCHPTTCRLETIAANSCNSAILSVRFTETISRHYSNYKIWQEFLPLAPNTCAVVDRCLSEFRYDATLVMGELLLS